jgi:hypothetical protein
VKIIPAPAELWRKAPFAVITHRLFDPFIMACIIGNVLFMAGAYTRPLLSST